MIKRSLRSIASKLRRYLSEDAPVPPEVPVHNTYGWLNYILHGASIRYENLPWSRKGVCSVRMGSRSCVIWGDDRPWAGVRR